MYTYIYTMSIVRDVNDNNYCTLYNGSEMNKIYYNRNAH